MTYGGGGASLMGDARVSSDSVSGPWSRPLRRGGGSGGGTVSVLLLYGQLAPRRRQLAHRLAEVRLHIYDCTGTVSLSCGFITMWSCGERVGCRGCQSRRT